MGKGGLNRLLLSKSDQADGKDTDDGLEATTYLLNEGDKRALHIRTILARHSTPLTLRVALKGRFLHDEAMASVLDDGGVRIDVPGMGRKPAPPPPKVGLIVAMQRPKVIGRILEASAAIGVSVVCVVAADKVEKSYWDCKLFRPPKDTVSDTAPNEADECALSNGDGEVGAKNQTLDATVVGDVPMNEQIHDSAKSAADANALPGRPRGVHNHPHRNESEISEAFPRRVDHLPAVHRRLNDAVQQACTDADLPYVILERRDLSTVLSDSHGFWQRVSPRASRVVAHPYAGDGRPLHAVSRVVAKDGVHGAVLAIGPEGGWTDKEVDCLVGNGFVIAGMGERVLRSETAVVVGLGLVHEGLRLLESELDARLSSCATD